MATLDPNRLLQDELVFELEIRGLSPSGTVDELRKTLRDMIRVEKLGKSFKLHTSHLEFAAESKVCESKLQDVVIAVNTFDGGDNQWKKWSCRTTHLLNRIELLVPPDEDGVKLRSNLLQKAVSCFGKLSDKREANVRNDPVDLGRIDPVITSTPTHTGINHPPLADTPTISSVTGGTVQPNPGIACSVPVHKWGLKFTGEVQKTSLNSFLEQVEDLRLSRGVGQEQLYNAAAELFEGKAKIWYRAIRRSISSWPELVTELKREFQPPDYAELLWEEIKNRLQGSNESIGMFFASMSNLFDRLSISVPEETRVKILRRNLLPHYQDQLALTDIHSEHELLELGRRLEAHRTLAPRTVTPKKTGMSLEPDLSYIEPKRAPTVNAISTTKSRPPSECWNCRKPGHLAKDCRSPKRRHCFSCGAPDVIRSQCPRCSPGTPRAGNSREDQSRADC